MKKLLLYIFVFFSINSFAQEKHISGFYNQDLIFHSDTTYVIDYNTRVSSEATLIVQAGVDIKFASGATIIIDGNLQLSGSKEFPIHISSVEKEFQGIGFVISGFNGKHISIQFTRFSNLLIPLTFKDNWYRKEVLIKDNIFSDINTGQEGIYIGSFSQIYSDGVAEFVFERNNFIENNASIFLSQIEDDVLAIKFNDNLITSNYMISKELNNPNNAPLSFYYDQRNRENKILFLSNSIFNNTLVFGTTIDKSKNINLAIKGSGESFEVSANYFGNELNPSNSLIHFFQDNNLPLLLLTNKLSIPSDKVHAHIWQVLIHKNGEWVHWTKTDLIRYDSLLLKIVFNRNIVLSTDSIERIYIKDNAIISDKINYIVAEQDSNFIKIIITNIDLSNSAIQLPIAKDNDGFLSPKYFLGNTNEILLIKENKQDEFIEKKEITIVVKDSVYLPQVVINKPKYKINTSIGVSLFNDIESKEYILQELSYKVSFSYILNPSLLLSAGLLSTTFTQDNILTDILVFDAIIDSKFKEIKWLKSNLSFGLGLSYALTNSKEIIKGYYHSINQDKDNFLNIPITINLEVKLNNNYYFGLNCTYYNTIIKSLENEHTNSLPDFVTIMGTITKIIR